MHKFDNRPISSLYHNRQTRYNHFSARPWRAAGAADMRLCVSPTSTTGIWGQERLSSCNRSWLAVFDEQGCARRRRSSAASIVPSPPTRAVLSRASLSCSFPALILLRFAQPLSRSDSPMSRACFRSAKRPRASRLPESSSTFRMSSSWTARALHTPEGSA